MQSKCWRTKYYGHSKANYKLIHTDNRCDHSYSFPFVFDRISFTLLLLTFTYFTSVYFIYWNLKLELKPCIDKMMLMLKERHTHEFIYSFTSLLLNNMKIKTRIRTQFFSSLLFCWFFEYTYMQGTGSLITISVFWCERAVSFSFAWLATIVIRRYIYYVCWFLSQFILFFSFVP